MESKKCKDCEEVKSIDFFYKKSGRKNQWLPYCKPCHLARNNKARKANPNTKERTSRNWKEYSSREEVKERRRQYATEYYRKRSQEDPFYVLKTRMGSWILREIKKNDGSKDSSVWEHLPYTPEELKQHIESQFEDWMTWDNHGEWHIDHIIPQSVLLEDVTSMDHPKFRECWALENLRPLEARENIIKRNKIIDE